MKHAILGTMTWGYSAQVKLPEAEKQLELFVKMGGRMIDTARMYRFGETEELIGELLAKRPDLRSQVEVHTKANPLISPLDAQGVRSQLEASLKALRMDCVDIFYLHSPDSRVPIAVTLKACDDLYREGKFKKLGLSAYASWDVVYAHLLCERNGWVRPTVYQGIYNAVARSCEPELIPALRTLGMNLYVYNPLAAGMLTDRYRGYSVNSPPPDTGRFSKEFDFVPESQASTNPMRGKGHQIYRQRYWRDDIFRGVGEIHAALDKLKQEQQSAPSTIQCAFSWLWNHSFLINGDGIIFGVSKLPQLEENMKALQWASSNRLPDSIVTAVDRASVHVNYEPYFRGYDPEGGKATAYLKRILSEKL